MTINIQNASTVNVTGHHNGRNCKAVYNITTGEIYASGIDAANALGVDPASVSGVLTGRFKTCKGMRLCFVSRMMEHLSEITEANRVRIAKVTAYDADIKRRNEIAEAQKIIDKHNSRLEELQRAIEAEQAMLEQATNNLITLQTEGV